MKIWRYAFQKTILCVEDDPIALMARRILLSQHGYEVLVASSGDAALRILADTHVDLVITDHFMPGMSGAELVAAMKSRNYSAPTAILTGAQEPPAGSELADIVLIKGCDPLAFLMKVAQLLRDATPLTDVTPAAT
jgi:CheY-like chemotaxis protein